MGKGYYASKVSRQNPSKYTIVNHTEKDWGVLLLYHKIVKN